MKDNVIIDADKLDRLDERVRDYVVWFRLIQIENNIKQRQLNFVIKNELKNSELRKKLFKKV